MEQWVTAWGMAATSLRIYGKMTPSANRTIRVRVPVNLAGDRLRLRLSNLMGRQACTVERIRIGLMREDGSVPEETRRAITFQGGELSVTLKPGSECVSNVAFYSVKPGDVLSVSLYFPLKQTPESGNVLFPEPLRSVPGNFTRAARFETEEKQRLTQQPIPLLSAVEIDVGDEDAAAVVAFGDSITQQCHWTNPLAERLTQAYPGKIALINKGISGNRLLRDAAAITFKMFGDAGTRRFQRDVIECVGAKAVIMALGINDLWHPIAYRSKTKQRPDFNQMVLGYQACNLAARQAGMRVIGATMTPFMTAQRYDAETEALRERLNDWIRESGEFDAVADFDAAVRNPKDARRMHRDYDSGDAMHPGPAGGLAMAQCIDLNQL